MCWMNISPSRIVLVIYLSTLALIEICEALYINRAPHFIPQTGDLSRFSLPENTPVGTPVYQLKGIDPENGNLHYSISGQYFTVDKMTGVIVLAKSLDREEQDSLEVIISLTDEATANTEPNTISLRRIIPVTDFNDNPPVFENRPYRLNISEDFPVGKEIEITPMIIVTDRDEGINSELKITCDQDGDIGDAEACATFRVISEKLSEGRFQIHLYLKRNLDYESRSSYVMSIQATDASDKPLKSSASIAIIVEDVQDQPPVFINAPYSATLAENTAENTSVMEINARDGDSVNPRPIQLSLEDDTLGYFKIVQENFYKSGVLITTDKPVDRENIDVMQNGGVYNFKIKATELNSGYASDFSVTQVTILITDVDDHIPEFSKSNFEIAIPENLGIGSHLPGLSIYVDDKDIGNNNKFSLKIRDVFNSENVFKISPDTGEGKTSIAVKVKDASKLDYDINDVEKRTFIFDIVASVNEKDVSSTRVKVHLLDTNDNSPVFEDASYSLSVKENAIIGYKIGDIQAIDKDYGIFGEITYLLTGFGAEYFKTDFYKGGIFVNEPLDYEAQKSFSLTLIAKDGGGKSSTSAILIELIDVNDNYPIFEFSEYTRIIRDGATSFEPSLIVRATDADGPTQGGGKVEYSIISENSIREDKIFSIDQDSGEITINSKVDSMDTPRGQYELIVQGTDLGTPALKNDTRVTIRVGVPGNQRPIFKGEFYSNHDSYNYPQKYYADLREDAVEGTNVTHVIANDPDGLDNLLSYRIVEGSGDKFTIDEKTGIITVSKDANLNRDQNPKSYELKVIAVDKGIPIPETAITTVTVNIIDVNDKPPKFDKSELSLHISEHTKVGEVIAKLIATDTDENANLKYTIEEPVQALDKTGLRLKTNNIYKYWSLFRINETNGEIYVNNSLDYNQASIILMKIKVEDLNSEINNETQVDLMDLTIFIQPYSDFSPKFTNSGWTVKNPVIFQRVKEEQPIGSTLLVISAEDPVSGHLVTNFKVINSETDMLRVDTETGQVSLTKRLDYEEIISPNLTLTVKATSNDGSKFSTAKLILQVVNVNDNPPQFEKQLYKVSILESIKYPEQILTVKAIDNDSILTEEDKLKGYSKVRYSLRGINSDLFIIDSTSGLIKIAPNKTLDRELNSVLNLEVTVTDTPNGGAEQLSTSTIVYIDVLDVNDNAPKFDKTNYIAVVPENVLAGVSVINMTAFDPDEGLGGEIKYDLMNEGEANGLFEIGQKSGEIKTKKTLTGRGRSEPYSLVVRAQDSDELYGDTNLNIYISDISANDGAPIFIKPAIGEQASINENVIVGSAVFQVVASDPDDPTQPAGKLYYSIIQNNADTQAFNIDPISGLIITKTQLDREAKAVYKIVIQVSDRGSPPQSTSRILQININDTDDHKPRFIRNLDDPPVQMSVMEEVPNDSTVGTIAAVDEDIGVNGAIDYIIIDGNKDGLLKLERTMENNAIIKTAGRIDREHSAQIMLTIKCFKKDSDIEKSEKPYNRLDPSEIQVLVKVSDKDDHLPEFFENKIVLGVRLNTPIDTTIYTFKAIDADPEAMPVKYTLVNATCEGKKEPKKVKISNNINITELLHLDFVTGKLNTLSKFTKHADHTFRLYVRANNSMIPNWYKDVEVELNIVRSRDLLRLDWHGGGTKADRITQSLSEALAQTGIKLVPQPPIAAVREDGSIDYTTTSLCFQLHANGTMLEPAKAEILLKKLDIPLNNTASGVTRCVGRTSALVSICEAALLITAVALLFAAVLALIILACAKRRYKKQRKRFLIAREVPTATAFLANPPVRMYSEPIYGT